MHCRHVVDRGEFAWNAPPPRLEALHAAASVAACQRAKVLQGDRRGRRVELAIFYIAPQRLGKSYAGKTLRLERRRDGTMILTAVAVVPESQVWTFEEPHRSRIARGLTWAAETPARETDLDALTKRAGRRRGRK